MRRLLLAMPLVLIACPDGQDEPKMPTGNQAPLEISADPISVFLDHNALAEFRVKNIGDHPLGLTLLDYASIEGDVSAQPIEFGRLLSPQEEEKFSVLMTGHALGAFSGILSLDSDDGTAGAMLRGRVVACPQLELDVADTHAVAAPGTSHTVTATLSNRSGEDVEFYFHRIGGGPEDFELGPHDGFLRADSVQPISIVHVVGDRLWWVALEVGFQPGIDCGMDLPQLSDAPRELDCLSFGSVAFCVNVSAQSVFVDGVSIEGEGELRPIEIPARIRPGESLNATVVDLSSGTVVRIDWRTPDEARDPIRVVFD